MKKAYLIHGWSGTPEHGWFPWLKRELEGCGWTVDAPEMPDADAPAMDTWMPFLRERIVEADEETVLVGHSMGGQAVLRFLEQLADGQKVGRAVLVAGVIDRISSTDAEDQKVVGPWLTTPMDFQKIKHAVNEIVGIFSDNDKEIPLESERVLKEKLGARTIIEHGMNHFTEDDGITELPVVLQAVIE